MTRAKRHHPTASATADGIVAAAIAGGGCSNRTPWARRTGLDSATEPSLHVGSKPHDHGSGSHQSEAQDDRHAMPHISPALPVHVLPYAHVANVHGPHQGILGAHDVGRNRHAECEAPGEAPGIDSHEQREAAEDDQ
jgi:hypothetical protein